MAGYADDTAIFLRSMDEIPLVTSTLTEFAAISGLMVIVNKSVVVPLSPTANTRAEVISGVPVLQSGSTCLYLGIRVGTHDTHEEHWRLCLKATAPRAALAIAKTHTLQRRVLIANAIIVSIIVFVARHMLPK